MAFAASARASLLVVVVAAGLLATACGCIYEHGTTGEAAAVAGNNWTYSYNGADWPNAFPACAGPKQSPVYLPGAGAGKEALQRPAARSTFSYGTLRDGNITNNGHTLQVSLPPELESEVKVPVCGDRGAAKATSIISGEGKVSYVRATPAQLHFHGRSEHVNSGAEYPLEMHIVHFVKSDQLPACGAGGCPVVLGVMVALTTNESEVSPELRRVVEAMPLDEGSATIAGELNVNALLPEDRTFFTYEGSLTTPPCTEGILWHVLATPIKVSQTLLMRYLQACGDLYCSDGTQRAQKKQQAVGVEVEAGARAFVMPPRNEKGCMKLANGHNWRALQPMNSREVKLAT